MTAKPLVLSADIWLLDSAATALVDKDFICAVVSVAVLAALLAMGAGYWRFGKPQPWDFSGQVIDSKTKYPIAGVEVDAEQRRFHAFTNENGRYVLQLPPPRPRYIDLVFLKAGYEGEMPVNVSTDREFNTDMKKLADK